MIDEDTDEDVAVNMGAEADNIRPEDDNTDSGSVERWGRQLLRGRDAAAAITGCCCAMEGDLASKLMLLLVIMVVVVVVVAVAVRRGYGVSVGAGFRQFFWSVVLLSAVFFVSS